MILVCCEHCGHKISVQESYSGKRGKCPKCGTFFIVPDKSTSIVLNCESCGLKISVPRVHAGKKGRCPRCKNSIAIPDLEKPVSKLKQEEVDYSIPRLAGNNAGLTLLEVTEEIKSKGEPIVESDMNGAVVDEQSSEEDYTSQRRFPWPISLFLYPVSQGVLCTIIVIVVLRIVTDVATVLLFSRIPFGGILGLIARVLFVYSYIYWYFSECIRDSAAGGLKAPEIIGSMPGLGDMICQFFRLFACYAFFLGPVTFYRGYTFFNDIEVDWIIFWSLLTYGVFFFPMGILAVVMFDSINGLNPLLLIHSIFSVFVRYCLLVLLLYVLGILLVSLGVIMSSILPKSGYLTIFTSSYVSLVFFIYALLIVGHLLGRFYYKYQDKLNWEV